MILFIAPNPFKVKEREGYLQRVAAIDQLFPNNKKYYANDCESSLELGRLILEANLIYVHSIYRAEEIIDCYPAFGYKIITDLHGVVPEEEAMIGEGRRSEELASIEEVVFKHGAAFVAVTNAMVRHFQNKYPESKSKQWTTLPIFEPVRGTTKSHKFNYEVVYAGGAQKWQNVDLMVDAINNADRQYQYHILTHTPEAFGAISNNAKHRVKIATVPSNQVGKYYDEADLGFILRDDTTVNNVACPTKIIEYLGYGVVPIVKSPQIGDFYELGYKYITLDDFVGSKLFIDQIPKYVESNYTVVKKLEEMTRDGKKRLRSVVADIKRAGRANLSPDNIVTLVAASCGNSIKTKELNASKHQIQEQTKTIKEYGKAVDYYREKERENEQRSLLQIIMGKIRAHRW